MVITEEMKNSYIDFAKNNSAINKISKYSNSNRKINKKNIKKMLENPCQNYLYLQQASNYLEGCNGIYKRLILYFSSLLTYDHYIYPIINFDMVKNKNKITKAYENVSLKLQKYNIKFILPKITKYIFTDGEVFLYKLEDNEGIVYKKIPNEYCRTCLMEDGVFRYEINMLKFTNESILDFPLEFQTKFKKYKDSRNNNNKIKNKIEDYWVQISDKGVCFPTQFNNYHSYPLMAHLLPDIMDIDETKDLKQNADKLENTKIIHSQVETNKETGLPIMDIDTVKAYNSSIQKALPDGMVSICNPFKSEAINLSGTQNKINNIVQDAIDYTYASAGVSDMLFANKKASSEALKKSIATDVQILFSFILPLYTNYLNYELKKVSPKYKFAIKILEITPFTKDEEQKNSIASMNVGGSRLKFMAICGHTPIESITIRKLENALDMDKLLIPKLNGNVISGKDVNNEGGRPSAQTQSEINENTEKSIEQK